MTLRIRLSQVQHFLFVKNASILSKSAFRMMTLSTITLSVMALSILTLSLAMKNAALSTTTLNAECP